MQLLDVMISPKVLARFTALGNKNYNTGGFAPKKDPPVKGVPAVKDTYLNSLRERGSNQELISKIEGMSTLEWIQYRRKILHIE